eukprot:TRINITY_DN14207_c0_g1_i1.p1 TRINITY_DN14207_c0_g1~~TRINITY_DN14207_c0_g1_i1.p1  ORF type:complete len:413 (+),score=40.61 TRINITY_DN14207_c0_g1_i1:99-1337(+)
MCEVALGIDWLMARVVERLSAFDSLAIRAASSGLCRVADETAADMVADLRGMSQAVREEAGEGAPWLRALAELHALPRIVCVGGYNSNWNRHESVFQDSDSPGSESSSEAVCTLSGDSISSWGRGLLPTMLHPRADLASCTGPEIKTMFALGGRQGMERLAFVECLDLADWRLRGVGWQPRPPMLQGRSGLVVGRLDGRLIAAGGRGVSGVLRDAETCDLYGDSTFAPLPAMQSAREYAASAVIESEFWVLGGGETGATNSTEIFDVTSGFWRSGPEMRESRYGGSAVYHEGRIFVIGGSVHFRRRKFTTLETLDPRESCWTCHDLQARDQHAPARSSYQCSLWGSGVVAHGSSLYLCGGTFRGLDQSLNSVYRLDLRTMQYETLLEALPTDSPSTSFQLQIPRWCGGTCLV